MASDVAPGAGLATVITCATVAEGPCWLARPGHREIGAVCLELFHTMRLMPGGAAFLAAQVARWRDDPDQARAELLRLAATPTPESPAGTEALPPGQYL